MSFGLVRAGDIKPREMRVKVEDHGITLDGNYFIERGRYNSIEKILAWVLHLSEKNWVNAEMIHDFAEQAIYQEGIKRPHS